MAADPYLLARKILFSMDAERAHHLTLRLLQTSNRLGILPLLTGYDARPNPVEPVEVMGLQFLNKVGLAAGLDKAGTAVDAFGAVGFGHIEVGTVTPLPQPGNEKPRLFRLIEHEAIINRMGFNNPGIDGLLENLEKSKKSFKGVLGINIGKNAATKNEDAIDDYLACFEGAYAAADYITANLSSPNTKGLRDLQNEKTCRELIHRLQEKRDELIPKHSGKRVPIVIKIAPDLSDDAIKSLAAVFSETNIDGIITTNTTIEREAVKGHARADEGGGLSGAPLTKKSTEILALLRSEMDDKIPIIGSGGVMSLADAEEKIAAGAALVQVYTGLIYKGPKLIREIANAL